MSLPARFLIATLILALAAPGEGEGNSLAVTKRSALEGGFGLELRLQDPARSPATEAWIGLGVAGGLLRDESALRGRFAIDTGGLAMSEVRGRDQLGLLRFDQRAGGGEACALLVIRRTAEGLSLGAWLRDDSSGQWLWAGEAPLPRVAHVRFEWASGSAPGARDGRFRLSLSNEPEDEGHLVVARDDLENAGQRVNHLRLGVVDRSAHAAGTVGVIGIDGFALFRGAADDDADDDPLEDER